MDLYVVCAGVSVDICIELSRVHMCVDACERRPCVASVGIGADMDIDIA